MAKTRNKYKTNFDTKDTYLIPATGMYAISYAVYTDNQSPTLNNAVALMVRGDNKSMIGVTQTYGDSQAAGSAHCNLHKNDRLYVEQSVPGHAQLRIVHFGGTDRTHQQFISMRTKVR